MTVTIEWTTNATSTSPSGGDTVESTYGILDIDSILTESYTSSALLTTHAVEEGIDVTDTSRPELDRVTLECAVSNTPIRSTREHGGSVQRVDLDLPDRTVITRGAVGYINRRSNTETRQQTQGVRVFKFSGEEFDRCREVWEQLKELKNTGTPIDIIGARFGDLESYQIAMISAPVENDHSVEFVLDIQEYRTATTQEVDAPSPQVERARRRQNQGDQPTTNTANSSEQDSLTSSWAATTDALESSVDVGSIFGF